MDATSYGSSRRKTYGGKDWRILGVNARISHPRLGVKIVPIQSYEKKHVKIENDI